MEFQLNIIGGFLIVLALIHVIFPKYFDWKNQLSQLSLVNQQMMRVHTFFIALTVFLMGILCLTSAYELTTTTLGKKISLGFAIFWGIRALFQFFVYSPLLWKGKFFETSVHILFSLFWIYLTWIFSLVCLN
jgi:hypothetical protein